MALESNEARIKKSACKAGLFTYKGEMARYGVFSLSITD